MKRIATTVFLAGLMGLPALALSPAATAAVSVGVGVGPGGMGAEISISTEPPPLPEYDQPVAPAQGYIWTPGYWAWAPQGYFYWVDGAWVLPPAVGLLWTPGWWGWSDGFYRWHPGYWGAEVGFYGGIDYGYGYFGTGYGGGYWMNNRFYYNTAVSHVNVVNIHNTYVDRTVIRNVRVNRVSYNGGHGGIAARPDARQRAFENQHRVAATKVQVDHRNQALRNPTQRYDTNRSRFSPGADTHAPAGQARPGSRPGVQSASPNDRSGRPGAVRSEPNGSAGQPAANRREPGQNAANHGAAPRSEPKPAAQSRPAQPSAPRVERPAQPVAPHVTQPRPQAQAPRPQAAQPRPEARPQAPAAPRFEPRPSRPEAQRPQMEMRQAPHPQAQPQRRGGGERGRGDEHRRD